MALTRQEMIDRRYSLECDSLGVFYDDDSIRDMVCSGNNIRFVCVKRGTYQDDDAPMEIKCKLDNNNRNHLTDRGDGSYTVYLDRDGQPLHFSPL